MGIFPKDYLNRIDKTLLENYDGSQSIKDSYYVYMLAIKGEKIDPFYIGKGKNSRIFAHENDAKSVINAIKDNDELMLEETISEKIKKIIDNMETGQSIKNYIIKWGLTENEAFMCESALINIYDCLYPNELTNIVNGHASAKEKRSKTHTTKAYEISEFLEKVCIDEINYEDTLLTKIPVIFIKVEETLKQYDHDRKREDIDYEEYVYESVQGYWKLDINKANKAKYVIALQNTVVRGIYQIDKWMNAEELMKRTDAPRYPLESREKDKGNIKESSFSNRIGFVQKKLNDDAENNELDELKNQLLNKIIKEKNPKKGSDGKSKSWFQNQNSRYNYDHIGDIVNIREELTK